MKIKDLIEQLDTFDPETEVYQRLADGSLIKSFNNLVDYRFVADKNHTRVYPEYFGYDETVVHKHKVLLLGAIWADPKDKP